MITELFNEWYNENELAIKTHYIKVDRQKINYGSFYHHWESKFNKMMLQRMTEEEFQHKKLQERFMFTQAIHNRFKEEGFEGRKPYEVSKATMYVVQHKESGEFLDNAGDLVLLEHAKKHDDYELADCELFGFDNSEDYQVMKLEVTYRLEGC